MFEATWWIFAIIIANSYTANLAAFLTSSNMEGSIGNLKDLGGQKKVKFGTIYGGSTYNLLAESNETIYRLAFNLMNNDDPSAYTKDNLEGVERVLKNRGDYMFLMETTTLEYHREQNCDLRSVGEKFGEKHQDLDLLCCVFCSVSFAGDLRWGFSVGFGCSGGSGCPGSFGSSWPAAGHSIHRWPRFCRCLRMITINISCNRKCFASAFP